MEDHQKGKVMNIERIRIMAHAERLMDAGKIPWVWSLNRHDQYERLSVAPEIMEMLDLQQGQTVNAFIVDAITELSLQMIQNRIEEVRQRLEDTLLTEDFDFRKEMDK